MVLGVEISSHPSAPSIEHNDRTRFGRKLMLWWLINADRNIMGDLLIIYVIED
jgi:hypothetical protein